MIEKPIDINSNEQNQVYPVKDNEVLIITILKQFKPGNFESTI